MANMVWVNIEDNHFKIWGFDIFQDNTTGECELITYWGRIGTPMQKLAKNKKPFRNYPDAYDYIMDKIKEKNAKGYKQMPNHEYFEYTYQDKPLSQLIEQIEAI